MASPLIYWWKATAGFWLHGWTTSFVSVQIFVQFFDLLIVTSMFGSKQQIVPIKTSFLVQVEVLIKIKIGPIKKSISRTHFLVQNSLVARPRWIQGVGPGKAARCQRVPWQQKKTAPGRVFLLGNLWFLSHVLVDVWKKIKEHHFSIGSLWKSWPLWLIKINFFTAFGCTKKVVLPPLTL